VLMRHHRLLPLLILGIFALPAWAQEKAELKWKFEKDKTIYQELTTDTTQDMKVMGMEVKQKQKQTFYFSWKPIEQKDKDWIIEQTIEGVKMEIEIGGNKISYDSTAQAAGNNPLADFFKALVGSKFNLTVAYDKDKGLAVTDVNQSDLDNFVNKLANANDALKPLLKQILTKDAIMQMSNSTFAAFPSQEQFDKGKGKWTQTVDLKMGPIGSYKTDYTYEAKAFLPIQQPLSFGIPRQ